MNFKDYIYEANAKEEHSEEDFVTSNVVDITLIGKAKAKLYLELNEDDEIDLIKIEYNDIAKDQWIKLYSVCKREPLRMIKLFTELRKPFGNAKWSTVRPNEDWNESIRAMFRESNKERL